MFATNHPRAPNAPLRPTIFGIIAGAKPHNLRQHASSIPTMTRSSVRPAMVRLLTLGDPQTTRSRFPEVEGICFRPQALAPFAEQPAAERGNRSVTNGGSRLSGGGGARLSPAQGDD